MILSFDIAPFPYKRAQRRITFLCQRIDVDIHIANLFKRNVLDKTILPAYKDNFIFAQIIVQIISFEFFCIPLILPIRRGFLDNTGLNGFESSVQFAPE